MTDPSHTLSDTPDEGDPAGSRTTPAGSAPAPSNERAPDAAGDVASDAAAANAAVDVAVGAAELAPRPEPALAEGAADRAPDDRAESHRAESHHGVSHHGLSHHGESPVAPAEPAVASPLAPLGFPEGEPQSLHPAHLRTQLIGHWIANGVLSFAAFVTFSGLTLGGALRGVWMGLGPGLAVVVLALLAWWGWRYQHLEHRRTSFVVSGAGFEIRRGLVWRRIITVPLSRIQHTDVTQGPLQRAYGLATLTLYTAGTEHAKVDLSGLAFETAMAIRQYLFERSEAHDQSHAAR